MSDRPVMGPVAAAERPRGRSASTWDAVRPYLAMARPGHVFKNAFMLLGVLLAWFYEPRLLAAGLLPELAVAFLATCLVAWSNYVINELADAPLDRHHPVKRHRPAASGRIRAPIAVAEWLGLGALGLALAFTVNVPFGAAAAALWLMGCAYNLPPVRTKDIPYVDVLTESINNPIRLFLGWHVVVVDRVPPLSLVLAFWMLGAFFMTAKRLAELRHIGDRAAAARYRRSLAWHDESSLLVSAAFYTVLFAVLTGIFIVRYKLELILVVPLGAGLVAYYLRLALEPDSPCQDPQRLLARPAFLAWSIAIASAFVLLMFWHIPVLYDLFNVPPPTFQPLWRIG